MYKGETKKQLDFTYIPKKRQAKARPGTKFRINSDHCTVLVDLAAWRVRLLNNLHNLFFHIIMANYFYLFLKKQISRNHTQVQAGSVVHCSTHSHFYSHHCNFTTINRWSLSISSCTFFANSRRRLPSWHQYWYQWNSTQKHIGPIQLWYLNNTHIL